MLLRFITLAVLAATASAQSHSGPELLDFDYDAKDVFGPENWRYVDTDGNEWEQYVGQEHINLDVPGNECKSTRRPSPINLVANAECEDSHEILTRRIKDTDCKMESLKFSLTPHTLRADFPYNDDSGCIRPTIDMPNGYPYTWFAHHIEVHLRAEHVLDGRRYDGEIQMFHLGREDQKRELATVSVLLDASGLQDDPRLQEYIDRWEAVAKETEESCSRRRLGSRTRTPFKAEEFVLKEQPLYFPRSDETEGEHKYFFPNNEPKTEYARALDDPEHDNSPSRHLQEDEEEMAPRRKMFPYDLWPTIHFYRYKGMITMPPCSEIVSWRVLDEPLIISKRQLNTLSRLMADYRDVDSCKKATRTSETGENVKPLGELNQEKQELVHCTPKDFTYRLYPLKKT